MPEADVLFKEWSGYLNNAKIVKTLTQLSLKRGLEHTHSNMLLCYQALVRNGWIAQDELRLLEAWLEDISIIGIRSGVMS